MRRVSPPFHRGATSKRQGRATNGVTGLELRAGAAGKSKLQIKAAGGSARLATRQVAL